MTKEPPSRYRKRWTPDDDKWLTFYWGHHRLEWIAKKLNRTGHGVDNRARILRLGSIERSTFSMNQLIAYLGVSETRIRTAADRCGIRISKGKRSSPRQKSLIHKYSISVDDAYAIEEYLKAHPEKLYSDLGERTVRGKWGVGKKPGCCVTCERTDRPHFAKGQCAPCYQKKYKASKYYTRWMKKDDITVLLTFAESPRKRYEFDMVLTTENQCCRVARGYVGDLRGYVLWDECNDDAHIFSISVHPRFRRRGIATMLLEDVIDRTAGSIVLEVQESNQGAIQLYKAHRFEVLGKKIGYYGPGLHALVMAKIVLDK